MMLELREQALKQQTAMELAWLQQLRRKRNDKGADDKHPDILHKQKKIIRAHRQCKVGAVNKERT